MTRTRMFAPSTWSELKAALLDLARALRPPAPQPVPIPVRPNMKRRMSARS